MLENKVLENCLAMLHPMHMRENFSRQFNINLNQTGSFFTPLKKASKDPEFSRPYVPGDLISRIDWKAFARTDQLLIREKRNESSGKILILCDCSKTMEWPSLRGQQEIKYVPQKIEIAMRIVLNLAHIHMRIGDKVEVICKDNQGNMTKFNPKNSSLVLSVFEKLKESHFSLEYFKEYFHEDMNVLNSYDRIYEISDSLNHSPNKDVLQKSRNIFFLHTLSSMEIQTSWMRDHQCYFDDTMKKKEIKGHDIKNNINYNQQIDQWRKGISDIICSIHGNYILLTDQTPIPEYFSRLGI